MNYAAYFYNLNDPLYISDLHELRKLIANFGPCIGLYYADDLTINEIEELDAMMGVEAPDYFEDFVELQLWAWNNLGEDI